MAFDMAAILPEGMGIAAFWALNVASFVSSFITAGLGIGGGALMIAVMASFISPAALIPVHGIVQLGSNIGRAALLWRHVARGVLPWFALGSAVGAGAGGLVVVELSPRFVLVGLGVFIIWSVLARPPKWLNRWPAVTGGVASFLTMFFGATGLLVAGFTKSLGLPRHGHVATHGALMTMQHLLKVGVFAALGFGFAAWWLPVLAMILSGFAGTYAGRVLLDRLSDVGFRRILDVVLVVISIRLIWVGLRGG